ncbi:hypothetical protein CMI37_16535 [Candidatus Pacearchaeota archaeon]|nr:hypothetical protein [Candidatus Pacearchaeota archaeon]
MSEIQTRQENGVQQSLALLPFTIKDRTLVSRGSKPGATSTFHLEEVRDYLTKLTELQDPEDHDRSLDQLHVDFSEGHMHARFLARDGIEDLKMLVTDNGASQLARDVLPSRFFSGLKQLAQLDPAGGKLATMAWAKFSQLRDKPRMVRTVNMQAAGGIRRVIRSCHSQGYAPYSNLQFVQDMLDHAGDFAELPILDWRVTDSVMRLRFAAIDAPLAVLRNWDAGALLNEPVPMVECWNSEVGRRRVGLRGGMWRLVCTNGMGHWDDGKEWNWIHRGDAARIQAGVRSAFKDLLTTANGVVDAYKDALEVEIDDAFAWMEDELKRGGAPNRFAVEAQKGLTHPSTTAGGRLASVVDAITLAAQDEKDLVQQYAMERTAATILRRGLSQSLKNDGRILAPV